MLHTRLCRMWISRNNQRPVLWVAWAIALVLVVGAIPRAEAQTLTVIHNFSGGEDGRYPLAGVTMDATGHLYGTTVGSNTIGSPPYGSVYKLTNHNGIWLSAPLYTFTGGADGAFPIQRVVIGSNGTIYGISNRGGSTNCNGGCGVVFNLTPRPTAPPTPLTPWREVVLYTFTGGSDGAWPGYGDLVFDSSGDIYSTASQGGLTNSNCYPQGCGVVFKLTRSGQSYIQSVIYSFTGGADGSLPVAGVVFDSTGNAYTTAGRDGANGNGTVIELTPSGGGYNETTIHEFTAASDGSYPWGSLLVDSSSNLYGSASSSGPNGGGTVFEMTLSGESWTYSVLQSLTGSGQNPGPEGALAMDAAGNLYGTTFADGAHGFGAVFKLTHSGGGWTYSSLHDFTGGSDGGNPLSNVIFDASGNIYGTASMGGSAGYGVVWEITP